jgi:hypothetical protein
MQKVIEEGDAMTVTERMYNNYDRRRRCNDNDENDI